MKIKLCLCLLISALNFTIIPAQKSGTADQFLQYLNNYQKKELADMTTADFTFTRDFSKKITDREEFLNRYLKDSQTLSAQFISIQKTEDKNQTHYLVEDHSEFMKLLGIKSPIWKLTITVSDGKVSEMMLARTEAYDVYVQETKSKSEPFYSWIGTHHKEVAVEKLEDVSQLLKLLVEYVNFKGLSQSGLHQYK